MKWSSTVTCLPPSLLSDRDSSESEDTFHSPERATGESWDWSLSGWGKDGSFECAWSKGLERRLGSCACVLAAHKHCSSGSRGSSVLLCPQGTAPHKHTDIIKAKINQEIKAMFEEKTGAVSIHCLELLPSVPFLSVPAGAFHTPCLDSDHSTNPEPRLHLRSFIILCFLDNFCCWYLRQVLSM